MQSEGEVIKSKEIEKQKRIMRKGRLSFKIFSYLEVEKKKREREFSCLSS